jgi:hypothetical protein
VAKPGEKVGFTTGKGYYLYYPATPKPPAPPPKAPMPAPPTPTPPRPDPGSPGAGPTTPTDPTGRVSLATGRIVDSPNIVASKVPKKVLTERRPYPWTSPSHPAGPHYTDAQLRAFGATPDEIWIINHESSGFTHAWNPILTPSGYAYGLGQITGAFRLKYFGANWESADPRVQIRMMQAYIKYGSANFHDDAGALAFWKTHHWY